MPSQIKGIEVIRSLHCHYPVGAVRELDSTDISGPENVGAVEFTNNTGLWLAVAYRNIPVLVQFDGGATSSSTKQSGL